MGELKEERTENFTLVHVFATSIKLGMPPV